MSRIHDALRRAEEELRKDGNISGQGPGGADQALEILEVLRVTENGADVLEAEPDGSVGFFEPAQTNWRPRSLKAETISDPPPVVPGSPAQSAGLMEPVLPLIRAAADGSAVIELPQAQEQQPAHDRVIPVPVPARPAAMPARAAEAAFRPSAPESKVSQNAAVKPDSEISPEGKISIEQLSARCRTSEWKPDAQRMLSFDLRSTNPLGLEEFRTLRSRLYHIRERHPISRLLVTSALPAEGKTFVSANLAQIFARQHGRKVLLVDCDLRLPHLHEVLGAPSKPGLSDYLRGDIDEFAAIQKGPLDNLYFIAGGRQVSNPAELIGGGRLELLLNRLEGAFDWIVIDSPPAVPVSDASVLSRFCHGVLLVVRAGQTPFDLAQRARNEFRSAPLLGVVLNGVQVGSTYVSYYYGAYGNPGENLGGETQPGSVRAGKETKS